MSVSDLTSNSDQLWVLVAQRLLDEGYTFNNLTTTKSQFIAAALSDITGQPYSNLTTSYTELLALLNNQLSDDVDLNNRTSGLGELLAGIVNSESAPVIPGNGTPIGLLLAITKDS